MCEDIVCPCRAGYMYSVDEVEELSVKASYRGLLQMSCCLLTKMIELIYVLYVRAVGSSFAFSSSATPTLSAVLGCDILGSDKARARSRTASRLEDVLT